MLSYHVALAYTFWPSDSCIIVPIINIDSDIHFLARVRHPRREKKIKRGGTLSQLITANKALIDVQLYVRRAEALLRVPEKVSIRFVRDMFSRTRAARSILVCAVLLFMRFLEHPRSSGGLFYAAYMNGKLLAKWNTQCAIVLYEISISFAKFRYNY